MDRNSFSIIIPMVGRNQAFDDTLASVLRSQSDQCQIIVAHDGNYTDPYDLRREVTFVQSKDGSDALGPLLNEAIQAATCPLTAIVRPGTELPADWAESVANAFEDVSVGSVAVPVTGKEKTDRIVTGGVTVGTGQNRKLAGAGKRLKKRSVVKIRPLGPSLWAGFYRTSVLKTIAPLCEQMEASYLDADIAMAARSLNTRCRWLPEVVATIDEAKAITAEAGQPHGRAAQRATRRHGLNAGVTNRVVNACFELLSAPLFPSMFLHALGRLFAGKAQQDAQFRSRIIAAVDEHAQRESIQFTARSVTPATRRAA